MWWGEGPVRRDDGVRRSSAASPAAPPLPALPRKGGGLRLQFWRLISSNLDGNPPPSLGRAGRGGRESGAGLRPATPQRSPRHAALVAPLLVAALALGGCVVRPLYADAPGSGTPVAAELSKIAVEPARNRVEQVLRNELIFAFTGGDEAPDAQYALRILLTRTEAAVAVERLSEVPASYIVSLSASFVLSDSTTGRTLLTGNSAADASYDFSSQRFANVRALEDAESRAAKTIAADIRVRLASYFATHR